MAPLHRALAVRATAEVRDGFTVYEAIADQEWSVVGKIHGGYQLALITSGLKHFQLGSHPDPAHLTASFLGPAGPGKVELLYKRIKSGRNWTNIECKLVQNGEALVLCQALYTNLPSFPSDPSLPFSPSNQNLLPYTPSPYAPISPFLTHPSQCVPNSAPKEFGRRWSADSVFWFVPSSMRWSEDLGMKKVREEGGNGETGRKKLEWGAWCELKDEGDVLTVEMLPFWADMMSSLPELLPEGQRVDPHYYPTLAMSIQFHAKLPLPSPYLSAPRTVGCFATGKFIRAGQHEQIVETWTSPGPIGVGETQEDWRRRSMCLCTSTQIALSVSIAKMKTIAVRPEKL